MGLCGNCRKVPKFNGGRFTLTAASFLIHGQERVKLAYDIVICTFPRGSRRSSEWQGSSSSIIKFHSASLIHKARVYICTSHDYRSVPISNPENLSSNNGTRKSHQRARRCHRQDYGQAEPQDGAKELQMIPPGVAFGVLIEGPFCIYTNPRA